MSGKLTTKQLQQKVDTVEKEFHGFANACVTDLMKLNRLMFGLLENLGKLDKINCSNCGSEVLRPNILELDQTEDCPDCGKNLFSKDTRQVTLDEMTRAVGKMGEEE